jgi:hypothetical protein
MSQIKNAENSDDEVSKRREREGTERDRRSYLVCVCV